MVKFFQKKKNNKGFSLVELIVVIAIMAVLVGVLAPTLIRKVEESRLSKDKQNLDNLRQAIVTALADEDYADITLSATSILKTDGETISIDDITFSTVDATNSGFIGEVKKNISLDFKLTSKLKKTDKNTTVKLTISENANVTIDVTCDLGGDYKFTIGQ